MVCSKEDEEWSKGAKGKVSAWTKLGWWRPNDELPCEGQN